MEFLFACRPADTDARHWASLLFGCAGKRALRLSRLRGRQLIQSMSGELLCRELLSRFRPGESLFPEETASGKLFLPGCALYLSISHSASWVAAVVADVPAGIDLQAQRPISDSVLRRYYSPEERSWISEGMAAERAVRLWTMKEAYGKMRGAGIFRGTPFFADFAHGQVVMQYGETRFLFPEAPEGVLLTLCLEDRAAP